MPSNRWLKRFARALRDLATHAHMRAELLPRLPFVIALVVSAVALAAAIEYRPGPDATIASVDELPSVQTEDYTDAGAFFEKEVELEIVEYGFSRVTDDDGEEYLLVAAVVDNPHDGELLPGGLAIQTKTERGYAVSLDTMYIGSIPARSTVSVGYVMPVGARTVEVENLVLEPAEPALLYREDSTGTVEILPDKTVLPTFSFTGFEALTSPDGYRLHFEAEAPEETDAQIAVLFHDSEGKLLGGLPANSGYDLATGAFRSFPAGESEQYVDVTAEWIPEGADLDRIEIGPSRY